MANFTVSSCPAPFLDLADFPPKGGFLQGRFCGNNSADLSCCLPCPLEHWVYSDHFGHNSIIAYWFNLPALVCQVFLLLSFAVLPVEKSHRHYLSIGLCVSLVLLELSFIIPLGTKPDECYDAVTPNDMYSDQSCAWSGGLLQAGAMAGVLWILLRSLWTHLRICYNVKHTALYLWLANAIAWGLTAVFLAISLPISGLSYRLGTTCLPNQKNSLETWFGWLIAFACLAALIQFATTGFCLWLYIRHFWQSPSSGSNDSRTAGLTGEGQRRPSLNLGKGFVWRRVSKVLRLQARSIVMSLLVTVEIVYFGTIYVASVKTIEADQQPAKTEQVVQWSACLVFTGGNKGQCLDYAKALGLDERTVVASLFMSALIGLFTFALMVRRSMFVGWYELIVRSGRSRRHDDDSNGFIAADSKRKGSEKSPFALTTLQPDDERSVRQLTVPEAGDVATQHETTDWFDNSAYAEEDEEEVVRGKSGRRRFEDNDT